jgi:hypothetical protein
MLPDASRVGFSFGFSFSGSEDRADAMSSARFFLCHAQYRMTG